MHRLGERGTYFVTASTYRKEHFVRGAERLQVLQRGLLTLAREYGWQLEAWAVFSNHYHFVAQSPEDSESLRSMLRNLHGRLSGWLNKLDHTPARKVWFNFRETQLTYEKSYLARLAYVHQNPVHHRLVPVANAYPWCSARWFERTATPAQVKTIYGFKTDQMKVVDDFQPESEW